MSSADVERQMKKGERKERQNEEKDDGRGVREVREKEESGSADEETPINSGVHHTLALITRAVDSPLYSSL